MLLSQLNFEFVSYMHMSFKVAGAYRRFQITLYIALKKTQSK